MKEKKKKNRARTCHERRGTFLQPSEPTPLLLLSPGLVRLVARVSGTALMLTGAGPAIVAGVAVALTIAGSRPAVARVEVKSAVVL